MIRLRTIHYYEVFFIQLAAQAPYTLGVDWKKNILAQANTQRLQLKLLTDATQSLRDSVMRNSWLMPPNHCEILLSEISSPNELNLDSLIFFFHREVVVSSFTVLRQKHPLL